MTVLSLLVASFITQGQPFLPTLLSLVNVQSEKVQQGLAFSGYLPGFITPKSNKSRFLVFSAKYQKILIFSQGKIARLSSHNSGEKHKSKMVFSPVVKTASVNAKSFAFLEKSLTFAPKKEWDMPQMSVRNAEQRLLAQYYRGQSLPMLRYGHSGNAVRVLQTLLTYNRYGVGITGRFDVLTETAVKAFQTNRRLVADGIVGSRTWRELTKYSVFKTQKDPMEIPLMFGSRTFHPWERKIRENSAKSTVSI